MNWRQHLRRFWILWLLTLVGLYGALLKDAWIWKSVVVVFLAAIAFSLERASDKIKEKP